MDEKGKGNELTSLAALIGALPNCIPAATNAVGAKEDRKGKGRNTMRKLNYQVKDTLRRNCDGSKATQANRGRLAKTFCNTMHALGFKNLELHNLKQKHIEDFVGNLQLRNLSAGTQKNELAFLRWLCGKIGKPNLIARNNDVLGIPRRSHVPTTSKGKDVVPEQLARIADPYVVMALRLQAMFGLRREESMKFTPSWADRGDKVVLKASWCKGGRAREVPVRTDEQRALLNEARALAGKGSLIPAELRYVDQLQRYKSQCRKVGISFAHGHRHWYAQERYRELTGWNCPVRGGPTVKQLTADQKTIDRVARMTVSAELGHGREQITVNYLGR